MLAHGGVDDGRSHDVEVADDIRVMTEGEGAIVRGA